MHIVHTVSYGIPICDCVLAVGVCAVWSDRCAVSSADPSALTQTHALQSRLRTLGTVLTTVAVTCGLSFVVILLHVLHRASTSYW